jgi:hypothetical protein
MTSRRVKSVDNASTRSVPSFTVRYTPKSRFRFKALKIAKTAVAIAKARIAPNPAAILPRSPRLNKPEATERFVTTEANVAIPD